MFGGERRFSKGGGGIFVIISEGNCNVNLCLDRIFKKFFLLLSIGDPEKSFYLSQLFKPNQT